MTFISFLLLPKDGPNKAIIIRKKYVDLKIILVITPLKLTEILELILNNLTIYIK